MTVSPRILLAVLTGLVLAPLAVGAQTDLRREILESQRRLEQIRAAG